MHCELKCVSLNFFRIFFPKLHYICYSPWVLLVLSIIPITTWKLNIFSILQTFLKYIFEKFLVVCKETAFRKQSSLWSVNNFITFSNIIYDPFLPFQTSRCMFSTYDSMFKETSCKKSYLSPYCSICTKNTKNTVASLPKIPKIISTGFSNFRAKSPLFIFPLFVHSQNNVFSRTGKLF